MSEEEKKAIHMLKSYAGMTHKLTDNQGRPKLDQAIDIALNLIEKQKRTNAELLTRLNADSLIDRDNYWRNKIINKLEDIEMQIKGEKANRYTIPQCLLLIRVLEELL